MKKSSPVKSEVPNGIRYDHPAYGTISVVKTQSSGGYPMFGSTLEHKQFVSIEISHACLDRKYHTDFVHSTDMIARFAMTEHQWAMFVASMGQGNGIPITLERIPETTGKLLLIDSIEGESFDELMNGEIKASAEGALAEMQTVVAKLEKIAQGNTISKKELKEVIFDMNCKLKNIPKNMAYVEECLIESKDKIVTSGKMEIEAFVAGYVTKVGIAAMNQGLAPKLLQSEDSNLLDTND